MNTKTDNSNKPWVSNYPPLASWLKEIGARCLQQTPVGIVRGGDEPQAYFETWMANGRVFLVEVRAMRMGWNVWTSVEANDIEKTLQDASARLGL